VTTLKVTRPRPTVLHNHWPSSARDQPRAVIAELGKAVIDKPDFHIVRGKAVGLAGHER
jgi:hypothetical protein